MSEQTALATDKEFSLISALAENSTRTQRELSESVGLSLGMTNILLKRLARKGLVKVKHLDWKRTQYLLTVKGVMEKTRKSYAYALHTIRQFQSIRTRIHDTIKLQYDGGLRHALIVAWPETAAAISEALRESALPGLEVEFFETFKSLGKKKGTIFTATIEPVPAPAAGQQFVSLLDDRALKFNFND